MRQNVLQGLDSKPILISRQRHLRRGDFGAPKVGLLSGRFSLGPPFAKFQKKADLGVLAQSAISQPRRPTFSWAVFPWSPLCKISKKGRSIDLGVLAQSAISQLRVHF